MLKNIKEFKEKHPIQFWIIAAVLFPLALILGIWLLIRRGPERVEEASKELGKSEAFEEVSDEERERALAAVKKAQRQREVLEKLKQKAEERRRKYRKKNQKVDDASTWKDLDALGAEEEK